MGLLEWREASQRNNEMGDGTAPLGNERAGKSAVLTAGS